jgi:hypothetical protein
VKETIILLHGTFAAPKTGAGQWYEPGSEFCKALDSRLAELGSAAKTWRHLEKAESVFSWSGRNMWSDRIAAARRFAMYLQHLSNKGWTCHVVAHSHGGNVLLEGLRMMLEPQNYTIEKWGGSSLVCLGTPYISPTRQLLARNERFPIDLVVSIALLALIGVLAWRPIVSLLPNLGWLWIPITALWMLLTLVFGIIFGIGEPWGGATPEWKTLLVIASKRDEVFQLLSQALRRPSPFRVHANSSWKTRFENFSRWFDALRGLIRESDSVRYHRHNVGLDRRFRIADRLVLICIGIVAVAAITLRAIGPDGNIAATLRYVIIAAALTFVACSVLLPRSTRAIVCLPARLFHAMRMTAHALGSEIVGRWFRRAGWNTLRQIALGTTGYPLGVEFASIEPDFLHKDFYQFQELPPNAEQEALSRREHDIRAGTAALTEALTQTIATDELLRAFERNPSLVHASYYQHPSCIDLIAKWIARTQEEIDDDDPREW